MQEDLRFYDIENKAIQKGKGDDELESAMFGCNIQQVS